MAGMILVGEIRALDASGGFGKALPVYVREEDREKARALGIEKALAEIAARREERT